MLDDFLGAPGYQLQIQDLEALQTLEGPTSFFDFDEFLNE